METYEIGDGFSDDIKIDAETPDDAIAKFRSAAESWHSDARVGAIEILEWKIDETPYDTGNLFLYLLDEDGDRDNSVAIITFLW